MALFLAGINHTTASVALREKVAFPPEIVAEALARLGALDRVEEAVIVSTCNRTELYLSLDLPGAPDATHDLAAPLDGGSTAAGESQVVEWLAAFHQLPADALRGCSYFHWQQDVVRHLMRVCCGLDSMVLGEPQILGQIKSAFAVAREHDSVGGSLGRAFQEAFSIAKEVRTDTAIGQNPVSVAYAAVTLAERIFSDPAQLSVLLIGAGHTIDLVARHLQEKGVRRITVANRTLERAQELSARFGGHAVLLSEIPENLEHADMVVSSTNSQLPLLGKGAVERAIKKRRHKPILLVDLAVPRDIEAEVGELADAYLYTIDDIAGVIQDNVKSRTEAAAQAESIINRGVEDFLRQLRALNAVDTLRSLRGRAETVRDAELEKALRALEKGDPAPQVMAALARALTNKLLHAPTVATKQASADGRDEVVALVRELYGLDGTDSGAGTKS